MTTASKPITWPAAMSNSISHMTLAVAYIQQAQAKSKDAGLDDALGKIASDALKLVASLTHIEDNC